MTFRQWLCPAMIAAVFSMNDFWTMAVLKLVEVLEDVSAEQQTLIMTTHC